MDPDENLSPEDFRFIQRAVEAWGAKIHYRGDLAEWYGVGWEAWKSGRERGIYGARLKQRIIWRVMDAFRSAVERHSRPNAEFGRGGGGGL